MCSSDLPVLRARYPCVRRVSVGRSDCCPAGQAGRPTDVHPAPAGRDRTTGRPPLPLRRSAPYRRHMRFQVVISSADPHSQCRFWAALLGYRIEHDPDLIRRMVDAGVASWDDVVEQHGELRWRSAAACSDPDGHGTDRKSTRLNSSHT